MDLATLMSIIIIVFLIVTMLSIGFSLAAAGVRPGRQLRPLAAVALVSLVAVPVVGIALVRLLDLEGALALALLALAVAPAGTVGPKLVQLSGGDLTLAVPAAFGLSAVATITVAPSLAIASEAAGLGAMGRGLDAGLIVGRLVLFQLLPLVVGMAIARVRPVSAARLVGPCTQLSSMLLVLFVVLAVVDGWRLLLGLDMRALVAALLLVAIADALGWLAGGPADDGRRSGMLISGQRSTALALLVVGGPGAPLTTAALVAMGLLVLVVNGPLAVMLARVAPASAIRTTILGRA